MPSQTTKSKTALSKTSATKKRSHVKAAVSTKTPQKKSLHYHSARIWHATPKFIHGALAGGFIATVAIVSLGASRPTSALSLNTSRDCDDYAIIECGSLTTAELQKDYSKSGVADVYSHFKISNADIETIDKNAVAGKVHDDGRVTVNGKVVATNAITAARKNINGSAKLTVNGTTFYVRLVSASFERTSSPAFVVMKDGEFDYAVLASCGNPVMATPVPAPKPAPQPVDQPVVAPPPVVVTAAAEVQPESLPAAGPGALIIIAAASVIGGFVTHKTHHHIKRRRAAAANR